MASEDPEVRTDGGAPPEDRDGYLADEAHDTFLTAREYLRDGYPPEYAADRAGTSLDLFLAALDGEPEDIRGTNRTTCDGCDERVTPYVSAHGDGYSGDVRTRRGVQGLDISWCAWDAAGIPTEDRPEGWRSTLPEDGFPCPHCGEEQTPDTLDLSISGPPEYEQKARCGSCCEVLRGDDCE